MPGPDDQQAFRQHLRRELRQYRSAAGLTQRDVAQAMDWSLSKVIRIESGAVAVSTIDLRALLAHYGVLDAGTVSSLIDLAKDSKKDSKRSTWRSWGQHSNVTESAPVEPADDQFFAHQAAATVVRQYAPLLIPEPLQNEEYLRAVAADVRMQEGEQLEHTVEAGLHRQQLLERSEPAEMFFILDEATLRRPVGGRGTMPRQLAHLAQLGTRRNISIQIVPFARGMYSGLLGPFVVLDFADADSVLYLEGRAGTMVRPEPDEVGGHLDHFQQLQHKLATDPEHLGEVIGSIPQPS